VAVGTSRNGAGCDSSEGLQQELGGIPSGEVVYVGALGAKRISNPASEFDHRLAQGQGSSRIHELMCLPHGARLSDEVVTQVRLGIDGDRLALFSVGSRVTEIRWPLAE
jgi:hypothetical protein